MPRPHNPLRTPQDGLGFTGDNGVPFGGIGAGCIELLPDGRLANFCTNNNYHRTERISGMAGSFLAFAAGVAKPSPLSSNICRLLQTRSSLPLGQAAADVLLHPEHIKYDGLYPRADIFYGEVGHGRVQLSLTACGPVVPGDLRLSCMPAALFRFTLCNNGSSPAWGSVMFSWENIAGCSHGVSPDGRNDIQPLGHHALEFRPPPHCRPNARGSHVLAVSPPPSGELSFVRYNTWNASRVLAQLQDQGRFEAADWANEWGAADDVTGAIACRVDLQPGQSAAVTFTLAWYYPDFKGGDASEADGGEEQGHQYANHFPHCRAVAEAALVEADAIIEASHQWQKPLLDSTLPPWLSRMLINSLYVLSPGTLWDRQGRYSLMETPYGPMMGTLDQRFYSSVATALFFPELEQRELALFAETRHPADRGRVYHDLGNLRFDDPKTGTTAKKWTDLNPKFILMAWRNYLWSNDREELARLFPYMRDMMAYTLSQDTDGDCLPNNEDRSTTYDDWAFFGANSYASGIWLAALHAWRRICGALKEPDAWQPYEAVLLQGTQQFEDRLWDEELGYYRLYNDNRNTVFDQPQPTATARATLADEAVNQGAVPEQAMADHPRINRDCHDGQLAGQWFAHLLGLGHIMPPDHVRRAVQQIHARNATPHGLRKGVTPDGHESANPPSSAWWSEAGQGWPGYEVAHYAALAIYAGETEAALRTVKTVYSELNETHCLTWNQPLRWNLDSGGTYGWGCDRYMNSPAVWHVYLALTGHLLDRPNQQLTLRPRLLPGQTSLALPLFVPGNLGRLVVEDAADRRSIRVSFEKPELIRTLLLEAGPLELLSCEPTARATTEGEWLVLTFEAPVDLQQNPLSIIQRARA